MPAEWVSPKLKNKYITEVLLHQALQPGGLALGRGAPRGFSFEGQWDLSAGAPQDWGNTNSILDGTHKVSCALGPGKRSDIIGSWARLWVLEVLLGTWQLAVAHCGSKDTGNIDQYEFSQRLPFWNQDLHCPTVCRLQCWDAGASGHTTNRMGTQLHPSADKLP